MSPETVKRISARVKVYELLRDLSIFHSCTVHLDIIKALLPTDTQKKLFKKIIKIYIKNAPTRFGVTIIIIIRERTIRSC